MERSSSAIRQQAVWTLDGRGWIPTPARERPGVPLPCCDCGEIRAEIFRAGPLGDFCKQCLPEEDA